jgi:signal transduction histidine kinase
MNSDPILGDEFAHGSAQVVARGATVVASSPLAGKVSVGSWTRWIQPSLLPSSWLPEFFSPFYDALESALAAETNSWVPLRELVLMQTNLVSFQSGEALDWVASIQANDILVRRVAVEEKQTPPEALVSLPECALLFYFDDLAGLRVDLWDRQLYGGAGASTAGLSQLLERPGVDLAWVASQLQSDLRVRAQLRRAEISSGDVTPSPSAILDLRLQVPVPGVMKASGMRFRATTLAQRLIREAQLHAPELDVWPRDFLLTGATLEERLDQFEEYLSDEPALRDRPIFVLSGHASSSQLFLRTLRGPAKTWTYSPESEEPGLLKWHAWLESASDDWHIFNSLAGDRDLPDNLAKAMSCLIDIGLDLPPFRFWRQIYQEIMSLPEGISPADWEYAISALLRVQERIAPGDFSIELGTRATSKTIYKVRLAYAPFVAIKALLEDGSIRIYLLSGPDQTEAPLASRILLEQVARNLAAILGRSVQFSAEVARRESLRRIREIKHTLARVLTNTTQGLEDLRRFAFRNPDVAGALVPDDRTAEQRAQARGASIDEYRMVAHLSRIEESLTPLRSLAQQLNRLSLIHKMNALFPERIRIEDIVKHGLERFCVGYPDVDIRCDSDVSALNAEVAGDSTLLAEAFDEVLSNAGRELKQQSRSRPSILASINVLNETVGIAIRDNGLPQQSRLIENPFEEGTSAYHQSGGGSGFGLAIVKAIFVKHGGDCSLEPNVDQCTGSRVEGVTFLATLPLAGKAR